MLNRSRAPTKHVYEPHVGASRPYWRDIILGVNDGLVSIFLLVAGVYGGGVSGSTVLLTAVAGAIAGSVSMGLGEYLATKSQDEVLSSELALERHHISDHREVEEAQLRQMLTDMEIDGEDLEEAVRIIGANDQRLFAAMKVMEFGVVDSERRSPYLAGLVSSLLFLIGALPATIPFAFDWARGTAFMVAACLTGVGLFAVGVTKTRVTKTNSVAAGLENLAVAGVGAALAFGVGRLFE